MATGLVLEAMVDELDLPATQGIPKGFAGWDQPGTYLFLVPPGVLRLFLYAKGADAGWGSTGGGTANDGCPPGATGIATTLSYGGRGASIMHVVRVAPGSLLKVVIGTGGVVNGGAGGDTTLTLADGLGTVLTAKGSADHGTAMLETVAFGVANIGMVFGIGRAGGAPLSSGGNIESENNNGAGAAGVGAHGWAVAMW